MSAMLAASSSISQVLIMAPLGCQWRHDLAPVPVAPPPPLAILAQAYIVGPAGQLYSGICQRPGRAGPGNRSARATATAASLALRPDGPDSRSWEAHVCACGRCRAMNHTEHPAARSRRCGALHSSRHNGGALAWVQAVWRGVGAPRVRLNGALPGSGMQRLVGTCYLQSRQSGPESRAADAAWPAAVCTQRAGWTWGLCLSAA